MHRKLAAVAFVLGMGAMVAPAGAALPVTPHLLDQPVAQGTYTKAVGCEPGFCASWWELQGTWTFGSETVTTPVDGGPSYVLVTGDEDPVPYPTQVVDLAGDPSITEPARHGHLFAGRVDGPCDTERGLSCEASLDGGPAVHLDFVFHVDHRDVDQSYGTWQAFVSHDLP